MSPKSWREAKQHLFPLRLPAVALALSLLAACGCSDRANHEEAAAQASNTLRMEGIEGSPSGRGTAPAVGAMMEYQRAPITQIREALNISNAAALTSRPVDLADVPVQRILTPQYVLVGPDQNHVLVVRLKELAPGLKAGQHLAINGVLEPLGKDLRQWELDSESREIVGQHTVFVNAIQSSVLPGK